MKAIMIMKSTKHTQTVKEWRLMNHDVAYQPYVCSTH